MRCWKGNKERFSYQLVRRSGSKSGKETRSRSSDLASPNGREEGRRCGCSSTVERLHRRSPVGGERRRSRGSSGRRQIGWFRRRRGLPRRSHRRQLRILLQRSCCWEVRGNRNLVARVLVCHDGRPTRSDLTSIVIAIYISIL